MINNKGVRYEHYDRNISKPYTVKELAGLYGVSTKTLRTWLLPHKETIGERVSKYYTHLQVQLIFQQLGTP